jgi:DNA-binding NarL/FixJ family response regulator
VSRVLICHDWAILREGMRTQLDSEPQVETVDTTDSGIAAMIEVLAGSVDVLVTGLTLRGLPGAEVLRRVRAENALPSIRVVVLLTADEEDSTEDVLRLGADGIIVNQFTAEDLCYAVRSVALGQTVLIGSVASRLVDWFRTLSPPAVERDDAWEQMVGSLTARESEVLQMVAHGSSTEEVAAALTIGVTTVRTHLHRLRAKLGVKDRAGLVSYAFRAGMVTAA